MDLISVDPMLNMYDRQWPIRTHQENCPPAKFVFDGRGSEQGRVGSATDSIVCQGSIISGGKVEHSIIGLNCRINSYSSVADSILFDDVEIGRDVQLRHAIVDKGVKIPAGAKIGFNIAADRKRGLTVTDSGIVVIGKGDIVDRLHSETRATKVPSHHLTSSRLPTKKKP